MSQTTDTAPARTGTVPGDPDAGGAVHEPASTGLVRTVLVRQVAAAGSEGLTRNGAERAVASVLRERLVDTVQGDIDSLVGLGVLRLDRDRLVAAPLADRYLAGDDALARS